MYKGGVELIHDTIDVAEQHCGYCKACKNDFIYTESQWHEHNSYSTKTAICPNCKKIVVLKITEDESLFVNTDERYFE